MSLTLARLCGEWRLVSEIYGAWSGKFEACIVIIRIPTADYFIAEYRDSSGKYEEVRSGKSKYSRYEYFDNIEESGKPLKKVSRNWKAIEEIGKPSKKSESR